MAFSSFYSDSEVLESLHYGTKDTRQCAFSSGIRTEWYRRSLLDHNEMNTLDWALSVECSGTSAKSSSEWAQTIPRV